MEQKFQVQYDEGCRHCPLNPKAEPPFIEKPKIEYTELTRKLLPLAAKKWNVPEECIVCVSLVHFWAHKFSIDKPVDLSRFK
jgi:hypothetical protein